MYDFSLLWILLCTSRLPDDVNLFWQTKHSNGFTPAWLHWCIKSPWLLWQLLPHSVHLNLPVWIFICCTSELWHGYFLSHLVHENQPSARCFRPCLFKYDLVVNRFPHVVHKCGRNLPLCFTSDSPVSYTQHETVLGRVLITHLISSHLTQPGWLWPNRQDGAAYFVLTGHSHCKLGRLNSLHSMLSSDEIRDIYARSLSVWFLRNSLKLSL